MLFNSFEFLIFLPVVFLLHWFVTRKNVLLQNSLLLIASYVFYAWWDWRFLFLIVLSSVTDYLVGLALSGARTNNNRKTILAVSLTVNLGLLGFFKYYNFFVQELIDGLSVLNIHANFSGLEIILPVGISFYTFQTMAYSIDVYRKNVEPERNLVQYLTFVSFFPQLVAGPIERSKNLLPQFKKVRSFSPELANAGLRQMLWGFFAKLVVADNIAPFVETTFQDFENKSPVILALAAGLFIIQIYADFSGYSNIAIGTAKLFGVRLSTNFRYPLFSRDISELWSRWHISLTQWCRDYIYISIGGSRFGKKRQFINVLVVFSLMGLWHGSNWNFLVFGLLNGLYLGVLLCLGSSPKTGQVSEGKLLPDFKEFGQMAVTFLLFSLSGIFFRSDSLASALGYCSQLFTTGQLDFAGDASVLFWAITFLGVEWFQRQSEYALELQNHNMAARLIVCGIIIIIILFYGQFAERSFIYFQF